MTPEDIPPTLDYRPPQDDVRPPIFALTTFISSATVVAVITVVLAFIVPRFETIFKDFGTRLPALTMLLLDISRAFQHGIWIVAAACPLILGFGMPWVISSPRDLDAEARAVARRKRIRVAIRITTLLLILFLGVVTILLFMPLISLLQAVSAPKK